MIQADAWFFDIDGTLLVTRDLVHWNGLHRAMLDVYGVDTTIEGLTYHGKTDVAILRAAMARCGVSGEKFESGIQRAIAVICEEVAAHAQEFIIEVCPGIAAFLARLQQEGKLLGVASGNFEAVGWSKVSAAGLREFFRLGSFGDGHELRAAIFDHAVSLARSALGNSASVCFIGDTPDDILAARAVHARVIAVSTGTFGFEELACLSPDVCCRSCCELLADEPEAVSFQQQP